MFAPDLPEISLRDKTNSVRLDEVYHTLQSVMHEHFFAIANCSLGVATQPIEPGCVGGRHGVGRKRRRRHIRVWASDNVRLLQDTVGPVQHDIAGRIANREAAQHGSGDGDGERASVGVAAGVAGCGDDRVGGVSHERSA